MPRVRQVFRAGVLLSCAAALVVAAPATADAKKKKKKPAPLTATVSGAFTIKQDIEGGFGNDQGPNWQQLSVEVKKAVIPFTVKGVMNAAAKASVTFTYQAEASTQDRSWHAGCDAEQRKTSGTWTGKAYVGVKETAWLQTNGKSKKYPGWTVSVEPPDELPVTTTGSYNDWESILMEVCQQFEVKDMLGGWSTGFARPDGVGKLAADNRSVRLLSINTDLGQTGKADGTVKFNKAPR
jgi:hypothetical protein